VAGVGINTAHQLGHKRESAERWLSKIALAQSFYGHFYIEHNRGHHVRVATPEDPASSRLGESLYRFWPRTVSGSLTSAWHLEANRYRRKGTHPFHLGNDVINAWLMSVVLWGALGAWLGVGILLLMLLPVSIPIIAVAVGWVGDRLRAAGAVRLPEQQATPVPARHTA
jgi:alkane 1-monooxygenase